MDSTTSRQESAAETLGRTLDHVFGRWPLWPWTVMGVIGGSGLLAMASARFFAPEDSAPNPALRWAALAGYGLTVGCFLVLVPRMLKLQQLQRALRVRPVVESEWWPYRLLASALLDVPALRATPEDFGAAVDRTRARARSVLAGQLWPVVTTAFIVPVLGLLSAWESGAKVVFVGEPEPSAMYAELLPQIAPPMVATILVSLVLMVVLVGVDQWTKSLLAEWGESVRFEDVGEPAVQGQLEQSHAMRRAANVMPENPPVTPPPVPQADASVQVEEISEEQISVDKFEDLKDAFRR